MSPFTRQPAAAGPSRGRAAHLLAGYLRFHRHLLALWRHTADPPDLDQPEDWTPWLTHRQHLLDALAACDGPRLAAETDNLLRASGDHYLASMLRALQARGLAMMQSLLSLENMLRRILAGHQLTLARRILSAHRASAACESYQRGRARGSRLDPDVNSPLCG